MREMQEKRKWNILLVKRVGILQIIPRSFPISEGWTFLWFLLYLIDRIPGYSIQWEEVTCYFSAFFLSCYYYKFVLTEKVIKILLSSYPVLYMQDLGAAHYKVMQLVNYCDIIRPCYRSKSWAVKVRRYYTI